MNKTTIDWPGLTHTWNPITGCKHGCWYCYAEKWATRFNEGDITPTFHSERFEDDDLLSNKPKVVFVGSNADMWGSWVPDYWIDQVLKAIKTAYAIQPDTRFMFLTKNPARYREFDIPANCWIGTTITGEDHDIDRRRIKDLTSAGGPDQRRFVSAEPVLGRIGVSLRYEDTNLIDLVIAGALTGYKNRSTNISWVADLLFYRRICRPGKVWLKKSMRDAIKAVYGRIPDENREIVVPADLIPQLRAAHS